MNFLQRLFGGRPDPTAEWPEVPPQAPVIHLARMEFGPLKFGASLDAAKALGRPDETKRIHDANPELLYARSGVLVEFEEGRFVLIAYLIEADDYAPAHPALRYARPQLILPDGSSQQLDAGSGAEELTAIWGAPEGADVDEDESVLTWEVGEVTIEAELNERAKLKRLSFMLTN